MNPIPLATDTPVPLEAIITTAELSWRPSRPPDHEAVSRALVALAQEMANSPNGILQKLVETALRLCQAHSAGVSILEEENGREIFRWHAVAGQWACFLWGTMPRELSPCGTVLDRDAVQLMTYPERYFSPLAQVPPRVVEALLIPFYVAGKAVGTIWVVSQDEGRRFEAEDLRVMTTLGDFAAAAYQVLSSLDAHKSGHAALAKAHAELLSTNERLEEQIAEREQAQQALREADRRKDEFLAVLAHEIRNPLAPIRNGLELLRIAGLPDPAHRSAYEVIDRQLAHLVRLVDDLVDVNRIGRGKLELRRQGVSLSSVLDAAVETARPLIDAARHELAVALPRDELFVDGDPIRLAQIFANLLNNSAKYTPAQGSIRVVVEHDDAWIEVRVEDSGVGISGTALPHVFEMFVQDADQGGRGTGGLGIGLALVRGLVEMHGGSVQAASPGPGCGSTFTARLPRARASGELFPARPKRSELATRPARRRVLVVDDNVDSARSMAELLRMLGHEVDQAYEGPAALETARTRFPDLVLLDIGMAGMSGHEVARRIRAEPALAGTTLIALTGYGSAEDRRESSAAGFDGHLVKPIDFEALQRIIEGLPQAQARRSEAA